jgi:hypothetical protein
MTVYEFAVAMAYAQLIEKSKTRALTAKEKGTLEVLDRAVARYRAREAAAEAAR